MPDRRTPAGHLAACATAMCSPTMERYHPNGLAAKAIGGPIAHNISNTGRTSMPRPGTGGHGSATPEKHRPLNGCRQRLTWHRTRQRRNKCATDLHGVGASPNAAHAECVRTQIETLNGRRWCRTHRSLPQHCAASGLAPTLAMSSAREWRRGLPQRWL